VGSKKPKSSSKEVLRGLKKIKVGSFHKEPVASFIYCEGEDRRERERARGTAQHSDQIDKVNKLDWNITTEQGRANMTGRQSQKTEDVCWA